MGEANEAERPGLDGGPGPDVPSSGLQACVQGGVRPQFSRDGSMLAEQRHDTYELMNSGAGFTVPEVGHGEALDTPFAEDGIDRVRNRGRRPERREPARLPSGKQL